jgi:hypothetical protein
MSSVLRGRRKHKALFNDLETINKPRKGRDIKLSAMRNECLIERYVFYSIIKGLRYDLILDYLSKDFFLSPITVSDIADNHYDVLALKKKEFKDLQPERLKENLSIKWPHLSW